MYLQLKGDVIERGAWCYSGYQQAKRWFGMLVIYSCRCIPTWLSSYSRSHFDETPSLRSAMDRRTVVEAVRCIARTRIKIPVLRLRGRGKTWEREVPTGALESACRACIMRCKYSTGRSSHPSCWVRKLRRSPISHQQRPELGGWSEMEVYSHPLTVVSPWCDGALVPTKMR
jgi:hypothetical protein